MKICRLYPIALIFCFSQILCTFSVHAKVVLPPIFGSNMVLQQESDIRLWGLAKPNRTVTIRISWQKDLVYVKTGKDGKWNVQTRTPKANFDAQTIHFDDGEKSSLKNILIGEVWLCSGQSNMEMTFQGYENEPVDGADSALITANAWPHLRLFKVRRNSQDSPGSEVDGKWQIPNSENLLTFSAAGYFLAKHLQRNLNIPVGIIASTWGGSRIEGWMNEEVANKYIPSKTDFTDVETWLKPEVMYNGMIHPLHKLKIAGICWYQGEANVADGIAYEDKLTDMIGLWRKEWEEERLPFVIVEIAPYAYPDSVQAAHLRQAQWNVANKLERVGFVCTTDLVRADEEKNIHPSNKESIGRRMGDEALRIVYGKSEKCLLYPYVKAAIWTSAYNVMLETEQISSIPLKELHQRSGLFECLDSLGKPIFAEFRIYIKDKYIVIEQSSNDEPIQAVQYAFGNFTPGVIRNECGLPLVPFRVEKP
jgi:sialate O-acetylesterase